MLKILQAGLQIFIGVMIIFSDVYAQERHITGKVVNEGGTRLSGAIILLKGAASSDGDEHEQLAAIR